MGNRLGRKMTIAASHWQTPEYWIDKSLLFGLEIFITKYSKDIYCFFMDWNWYQKRPLSNVQLMNFSFPRFKFGWKRPLLNLFFFTTFSFFKIYLFCKKRILDIQKNHWFSSSSRVNFCGKAPIKYLIDNLHFSKILLLLRKGPY